MDTGIYCLKCESDPCECRQNKESFDESLICPKCGGVVELDSVGVYCKRCGYKEKL